MRGPEHELAWCDEIAKWKRADAWDHLMLGLRLGDQPQVLATTTPQPKKWLMNLIEEDGVHLTQGRTLAEQRQLVAAGKSQTMRSRHLTGHALDFVPLDPTTGKGRFDRALAIEVAAAFMDAGITLKTPVKWGGMWQNFEDIPHIELISP